MPRADYDGEFDGGPAKRARGRGGGTTGIPWTAIPPPPDARANDRQHPPIPAAAALAGPALLPGQREEKEEETEFRVDTGALSLRRRDAESARFEY